MFEDIKTLFWFLKRPNFYATMISLVLKKFLPNKDSLADREEEWCQERTISVEECFKKLDLDPFEEPPFSKEYIEEVEKKIKGSNSNFGGQGHVNLLYGLCESLKAKKVLETGVAYGWSSQAILNSISKREGKLVSVDMPMVKQTDYHLIGVAVEEKNLPYWDLIREPDKYGLYKAIRRFNSNLDLVHYDSDKSYYGRKWSQRIIWNNVKEGGVFVSDDVEDNSAFKEFVEEKKLDFMILKFEGKYVGVIKKYVT